MTGSGRRAGVGLSKPWVYGLNSTPSSVRFLPSVGIQPQYRRSDSRRSSASTRSGSSPTSGAGASGNSAIRRCSSIRPAAAGSASVTSVSPSREFGTVETIAPDPELTTDEVEVVRGDDDLVLRVVSPRPTCHCPPPCRGVPAQTRL